MANDRLIDRLVSDLKPVRRRSLATDAAILAVVCLAELALFLALGFMRPDMSMAMQQPSFWWKLCSLGLIALIGIAASLWSFDPVRSPSRGLQWLVAAVALSLAAGWAIDASRAGLPSLAARLDWHDGMSCVFKMVVLSIPAVIGLGLLMRRGAPSDTTATALTVGVASAGWGAFVFVFACPYDDPLYIAVWYAVGCAIVTVAARLVLPWLTRW